MKSDQRSILFTAPYTVEIERKPCPRPAAHELLVETELSAISTGSELLFYRGQAPADLPADAVIAALATQRSTYPIRYGYACVGRVAALGEAVDQTWLDRRVFAFQPHSSHFVADVDDVLVIPDAVESEQAVLLPNMETAVNFVMDGRPVIGEHVTIFGLGIVGLLTASLLTRFPLSELVCFEPLAKRRAAAQELGVVHAYAPDEGPSTDQFLASADLTFELSGNPAVLNNAIAATGYGGRVVIGSWYGEKSAPLQLGRSFHRSRIRLLSSQVSTLDPRWQGRWTKARRFAVAWQMLAQLPVDTLVTHRLPMEDAATAYSLLDEKPEQTVQVLLTY